MRTKTIYLIIFTLFINNLCFANPKNDKDYSPEATSNTSKDLFLYAQKLEKNQRFTLAKKKYKLVTEKYPNAKEVMESYLKIGEMMIKEQDYEKAFYYFEDLIDERHKLRRKLNKLRRKRETRKKRSKKKNYINKLKHKFDLDRILSYEYEIGLKFLNGARKKVYGVKLWKNSLLAEKIFLGIRNRAPYHSKSALCQYGIAIYHKQKKDYMVAIQEFRRLLNDYSLSEPAEEAYFQIGECYFKQIKSAGRNSAIHRNTITNLKDYLYNKDAKNAEQAKSLILKTREIQAKSILERIDFFNSRKQWKASAIYLKDLINKYPETKSALKGKDMIERNPKIKNFYKDAA